MSIFLSTLSCIPCRKENNDRSEMVSQILFGESYSIIETKDKWLNVKTLHDNYVGWIDLRQHQESQQSDNNRQSTPLRALSPDLKLVNEHDHSILISPGSPLPWACHGQIGLNGNVFDIKGEIGEGDRSRLLNFAQQFINTPYLWGGRSIWGIDCSGFTQVVFAMTGVSIPRDASQQVTIGEAVPFEQRMEGDLAFFQNQEKRVTHVGIVMNGNKIIHASGKVRIDTLDDKGIKVVETDSHSHQFHSIRRM